MKIAISHYGRFESEHLGLFLNRDDTFIVTPKIEKSKQFQTGLARKRFQFIEVTDLAVVERAVNVTDKIVENYRTLLTTDPEPEEQAPPAEPEPEPEPESEPESEPEPQPDDEQPAENEGEKTEEPPKEEEQVDEGAGEDSGEGEGEGEGEPDPDPVLPFTELAGNVENAQAAVEKETDIEKLKFALEHDSRVSVRTAIEARIKELES